MNDILFNYEVELVLSTCLETITNPFVMHLSLKAINNWWLRFPVKQKCKHHTTTPSLEKHLAIFPYSNTNFVLNVTSIQNIMHLTLPLVQLLSPSNEIKTNHSFVSNLNFCSYVAPGMLYLTLLFWN